MIGTLEFRFKYSYASYFGLIGWMDSDWRGSLYDKKLTFDIYFSLGSELINWSSRKYSIVALFSIDVEYVAATSTNQAL